MVGMGQKLKIVRHHVGAARLAQCQQGFQTLGREQVVGIENGDPPAPADVQPGVPGPTGSLADIQAQQAYPRIGSGEVQDCGARTVGEQSSTTTISRLLMLWAWSERRAARDIPVRPVWPRSVPISLDP